MLFQISSAGNVVNQASNALGSNAITNALGIDFGTILTPSKFLTKFTPSTVFAYRSLAYEIQSSKNFDVIFHWFPRSSQIRTMFSNAFSAADTNEINLLVRNIQIPNLSNGQGEKGNGDSRKFQCVFPGSGVNSEGDLSMTFLNTEFSYVHHCFYQWLCETESPFWIYGPGMSTNKDAVEEIGKLGKVIFDSSEEIDISKAKWWMSCDDAFKLHFLESQTESAPFTRADIEVKMYSGNMKELHSYWFMGAFPVRISTRALDHAPTDNGTLEGNTVIFTFDSMCISSPFSYGGKNSGALTKAASGLFGSLGSNSAEWTAGLYDDTLTQIGNTYLAKASRRLNKIMNKTGNKVSDKLKSYQSKLIAS